MQDLSIWAISQIQYSPRLFFTHYTSVRYCRRAENSRKIKALAVLYYCTNAVVAHIFIKWHHTLVPLKIYFAERWLCTAAWTSLTCIFFFLAIDACLWNLASLNAILHSLLHCHVPMRSHTRENFLRACGKNYQSFLYYEQKCSFTIELHLFATIKVKMIEMCQ